MDICSFLWGQILLLTLLATTGQKQHKKPNNLPFMILVANNTGIRKIILISMFRKPSLYISIRLPIILPLDFHGTLCLQRMYSVCLLK